jgi:hypothetical protein
MHAKYILTLVFVLHPLEYNFSSNAYKLDGLRSWHLINFAILKTVALVFTAHLCDLAHAWTFLAPWTKGSTLPGGRKGHSDSIEL